MKEVMEKVNELFDLLVQKNKEADAREVSLNEQKLAQERIDGEQATKKTELVEREAAVSRVESVVDLKNEVETKLANLGVMQDAFVKKETAHKELVERELKAIEEQKIDLKSQLESIAEREKKLTGEFQKTIIQELLNKMKKVTP